MTTQTSKGKQGGIHKYWFYDFGQMTIFKTTYPIDIEDLEEYIIKKYRNGEGIHSCGELTAPLRRIKEITDGGYTPRTGDDSPLTIQDGEEIERANRNRWSEIEYEKMIQDGCPKGSVVVWNSENTQYNYIRISDVREVLGELKGGIVVD